MNTTKLISADGTPLAFSRTGTGAPLILVDGAFCHRKFGPNAALAETLAADFTVYIYDRRGRGESGNTLPYAVEKEYQDLEALLCEAGGEAFVYGISSGAALALEAANSGVRMKKLALYEVPYIVDHSRQPFPPDYREKLIQYLDEGERSKAVRYFMREGIGLPAFAVGMMRLMPAWKKMKQVAHTVPYDTALLGNHTAGQPFDKNEWQHVDFPVQVLAGSKSEKWMQHAMKALSGALPYGNYDVLDGQTHMVNPKVLAAALKRFFTEL